MRTIIKEQLSFWFPVYIWAALVFYFSSTVLAGPSVPASGAGFMIPDYYKHVLAYGFFTFLLWRAFRNSKLNHPEVFAVIITLFYGISNELNQYFIPGRCSSAFDVFFDFAGSILVQPLLMLYKKIPRRK